MHCRSNQDVLGPMHCLEDDTGARTKKRMYHWWVDYERFVVVARPRWPMAEERHASDGVHHTADAEELGMEAKRKRTRSYESASHDEKESCSQSRCVRT